MKPYLKFSRSHEQMLQSYFAVIPGFRKMRRPVHEQQGNYLWLFQKRLASECNLPIIQLESGREVLVLVSLVHRRSYCSRGALLLSFPGWSRQDRIVQHSTVAHHPCHFGSCSRRQPLVALGRAAHCCHRSSPTAGGPRNSLCAVLPSPLDVAPELSLTHPAIKREVCH